MAKKNTIWPPLGNSLLPLRNLQGVNEIDAILGTVIKGTRKQVHEAIGFVSRICG
ncbi:MAG: hypothetical protein ACRD22_19680 [Terriglobia bacterium]